MKDADINLDLVLDWNRAEISSSNFLHPFWIKRLTVRWLTQTTIDNLITHHQQMGQEMVNHRLRVVLL
ncbi:hypothetical protein ElyMa_006992700, partial [Elysia marginata]